VAAAVTGLARTVVPARVIPWAKANKAGLIFVPIFAVLVLLATSGRSHSGQYLTQLFFASLDTGPVAALSGVGLVLTYNATGVFNFAQGGVATVCAFAYYELVVRNSVPNVVGAVLAIGVLCPLIGLAMERVVFRPLQRRSASTSEKLVANLGALVLLLAIPGLVFGQSVQTDATTLFPSGPFTFFGHKVEVAGAQLAWSAAGSLLSVLVVAAGLTVLLRFTRLGLQVRAVVDRRGLAELAAVNANRVSAVAWVLGCTFAGLVGVLYAPVRGLTPYGVTLTVLETIAVAAVARLRGIPTAVVGGLLLGFVQSYLQVFQSPAWPDWLSWLPDLPQTISTNIFVIALVAVLLIFRSLDEVGTVGSQGSLVTFAVGRVGRNALVVPLAGGVIALLVPLLLNGSSLGTFTLMIGYAIAFLGIVAITGFSGHISLATVAFAGLGAYISVRLSNGYLPDIPFVPVPDTAVLPHVPVILSTLLAGLLVIPLGVIVGFPALRRKGLILGLITLAFAQLADRFIFNNADAVTRGTKPVRRPELLGIDLTGDLAFAYYGLVVLGLCLLLTRNLRSGTLGRVLGAMRDSENGSVSVGISLRRYKLFIFGASAFLGGVGGAIISQSTQSLAYDDQTFNPLIGLFWFTAVVVAGLSYPSGAILASVLFVGIDKVSGQNGLSTLVIGLLALVVGFFPGGLVGQLSKRSRSGAFTRGLEKAYATAQAEGEFTRRLNEGDTTAIDPRTGEPPPGYVPSDQARRLFSGTHR
jgi:branched-chain amino acid transport system permease protein